MFDIANYVNPFDCLDRRWQRITGLVNASQRPLPSDDKYIWRGWRFLRDMTQSKDDAERYHISQNNPEAATAVGWRMDRFQKREYVEAMSLCENVSIEQMALYLQSTPAKILTYEKLFFDVRDSRDNKDFICLQVLQPAIIEELHNGKSPVFAWKLCAIFGGIDVLRSCWQYHQQPKATDDFHHKAGISLLMRNFGLGNFFRPVNSFTMREISEEVIKLLDVEVRKAALAGMSQEVQERANIMRELLSAHPFMVMTDQHKLTDGREPSLAETLTKAVDFERKQQNPELLGSSK